MRVPPDQVNKWCEWRGTGQGGRSSWRVRGVTSPSARAAVTNLRGTSDVSVAAAPTPEPWNQQPVRPAPCLCEHAPNGVMWEQGVHSSLQRFTGRDDLAQMPLTLGPNPTLKRWRQGAHASHEH